MVLLARALDHFLECLNELIDNVEGLVIEQIVELLETLGQITAHVETPGFLLAVLVRLLAQTVLQVDVVVLAQQLNEPKNDASIVACSPHCQLVRRVRRWILILVQLCPCDVFFQHSLLFLTFQQFLLA